MKQQRDETEARSKEAEASMVSIDGQWLVVYFETHATKEQYAHTHAYSQFESNHEVSRFFIPITCSLSLSLFSHILLVPPFLVTFMVLYDRPIFDTLRVLPHALPYTGYIYIYTIWCIFKESILDIEINKKNWYIEISIEVYFSNYKQEFYKRNVMIIFK